MKNKIYISELGLTDGSVFEKLIFNGTVEELSNIIDFDDSAFFTLETENKKLYIPYGENITYLIFDDKKFEPFKKAEIKFSPEIKKADKKNTDGISEAEIDALLNEIKPKEKNKTSEYLENIFKLFLEVSGCKDNPITFEEFYDIFLKGR